MPVWIRLITCLHFEFHGFFFFFLARMNSNRTVHAHGFTVQETKYTVHGTHNHFIQKKNIYIKNRSHGTIHIFKNYFAIVFSVFNKISCIQTDPKKWKRGCWIEMNWYYLRTAIETTYSLMMDWDELVLSTQHYKYISKLF